MSGGNMSRGNIRIPTRCSLYTARRSFSLILIKSFSLSLPVSPAGSSFPSSITAHYSFSSFQSQNPPFPLSTNPSRHRLLIPNPPPSRTLDYLTVFFFTFLVSGIGFWAYVKHYDDWLTDWNQLTPALQQLHWLPVEYRIKYKLCALMHQIHTGRAPQYLVDSVQSFAESSRRPGLRSANTADYGTSNAALVRSLVNVASVMLVQLPGTLYLPALSSLLTPIDSRNLIKAHLFHIAFWHLLAPLDNL